MGGLETSEEAQTAGGNQVVHLPLALRNRLKDEVEVLLKDYLRDNLGNWKANPTPERIDEYLRFHMPGYTRESVVIMFERYLTELIGLVSTKPSVNTDAAKKPQTPPKEEMI